MLNIDFIEKNFPKGNLALIGGRTWVRPNTNCSTSSYGKNSYGYFTCP